MVGLEDVVLDYRDSALAQIQDGELDQYVCKILGRSYNTQTTLLNVTHSDTPDIIDTNPDPDLIGLPQPDMNGIFQMLNTFQGRYLRGRDVTRLFNIYLYFNDTTENLEMGFIFNSMYKDIFPGEYVQLKDLISPVQETIDDDTRVVIIEPNFEPFFSLLYKTIRDSHRCDEILRDILPNGNSEQSILVFSFDYYHNRSSELNGGFHRDSFGFTKYVNLIFDNTGIICGPEVLPTAEYHEDILKKKLDYARCFNTVCRPMMMPYFATIGFKDSFVQHATPSYDNQFSTEDRFFRGMFTLSSKRLEPTNPILQALSTQQRTFIRIWTQVYSGRDCQNLILKIKQQGNSHRQRTVSVIDFQILCQNNKKIPVITPPTSDFRKTPNLDYPSSVYVSNALTEVATLLKDTTYNRGGKKRKSKTRKNRKYKSKSKKRKHRIR